MRYQNERFENAELHLDGNSYERCHFVRCSLLFSGIEQVEFDGCLFTSCKWSVDGPAETTLVFLSALYQGLGEAGRALVDEVIDSVRSGTILRQGVSDPAPAALATA